MAYQSVWYFTGLPKGIIEILEKDLKGNYDDILKPSKLGGDHINENIRNSKIFIAYFINKVRLIDNF